MGKKRRLNRFISKWLKSDLPEERSTVLLLGVTRIPTTPAAARRPCLLPTVPAVVGGRLHRRNSSGAGSRKGGLVRRNSSRKTADCRHLQQVQPADDASTPETPTPTPSPSSGRCTERSSPTILAATPPVKCVAIVSDVWKPLVADAMERSVDSIGTCSLDVDASADLSEFKQLFPVKRVSYESKSVTAINGQTKCLSETSGGQEFRNGQETKSFIQQRVERLYGPGALAQGFFKPQKKRVSDCDEKPPSPVVKFDVSEPAMRQSTSSPTLPVLRHLRPEFRAQLPFMSPKRGSLEGAMQKSVTVPTLLKKEANGEEECAGRKEETNGHVGEGVQGEADFMNIFQSVGESFPTTNEDLQGFWDMVMLQVDQVDAIFQEIEDLKANGWREPVAASPPVKTANGTASKPRKVVARPSNKPSSAASEEARKQREAQRRKMIEDRRKAMKIAQQNEPRIEIYVPDATS
nr:uncharacterized protein LOC111513950 [Leptinotarsa decemlineata]